MLYIDMYPNNIYHKVHMIPITNYDQLLQPGNSTGTSTW